jgi:heptosyltransferase-2
VSRAATQQERRVGDGRILIVQTAFLGDTVLPTPLLRELRRARPRAELWLLTTETGRLALEASGHVDRWLVLDKRWGRAGRRSWGGVLRGLLGGGFAAAVAAHRSVRTGVLLRLSGARLRVGFAGAPGAWAYNRRIRWDAGRHAVHRYLELARPLGGDPEGADPQPALAVDPAASSRVDALLARCGIDRADDVLCVAPGSVWPTKRWLPEGFARVVEEARGRGLAPVLLGSPEERSLCERVAALAPAPVLAGSTTVVDLVALVGRARLLVGNDSGAAHVASAVGTPVVSVFGSTVPGHGYAAYGPGTRVVEQRGLACRPCGRHGARACPLGHFACMSMLRPERVLEEIDGILAATPGRAAPLVPAGHVAPAMGGREVQGPLGVAPG